MFLPALAVLGVLGFASIENMLDFSKDFALVGVMNATASQNGAMRRASVDTGCVTRVVTAPPPGLFNSNLRAAKQVIQILSVLSSFLDGSTLDFISGTTHEL